MSRASLRRAAAFFVLAASLVFSSPALAQTATTPGTVEFTPSSDNTAVATDGTAIVREYLLSVYAAGQTTAIQTLNIGKPSPDADGKIRVEFLSKLTVALTPGLMYEARVVASGPGGTAVSAVSNQFQAAVACSTSLASNAFSATSAGVSSTLGVTAPAGCPWSAASNAGWLTVTSGASGSGPGTVGFTVAANSSTSSRTGAITVDGQVFTVTQAAFSCSYSLSSASQTLAAAGGSGSVALSTAGGCGWTASSSAAWLTLTSPASGSGAATVGFTAASNGTTSARTATLTIGGQLFTVTQAALSCSYSLSSASQAVAAAGGTGSVALSTASACGWTASSSAAWLTLTSPASGSGSATVGFSAAANGTTSARTATLTIGDQTFAVTQAGVSCSYTLANTSQNVAATGGAGSFSVTAPTGCDWSTTSSDAWVTVTGGSTGSGNGTVSFSTAPNSTTAARTATLTVGGQASTVGVSSVSQAPIVDDFNRANGDLGFSWRAQSAKTLSIISGTVAGVQGEFACSNWSPSLTAFASDQSAQARIAFIGPADSVGVTVRTSGSFSTNNFSGYLLTADGTSYSTLDKIVSGVGSQILDLSSVRWAAGDIVKLVASGRTLTAYKNGQVIGTVTDPDLTAGQPGGCIFDSPSDGVLTTFDDWSGETSGASVVGAQSVTAAGPAQLYTVSQAGVSCSSSIAPLAQSQPAAGGSGSVTVSATSGCAWAASTTTSWLSVTAARQRVRQRRSELHGLCEYGHDHAHRHVDDRRSDVHGDAGGSLVHL